MEQRTEQDVSPYRVFTRAECETFLREHKLKIERLKY